MSRRINTGRIDPKIFFNVTELRRIEGTVRTAESRTSGEIRVMVTSDCTRRGLRKRSSAEEAEMQFVKHGLHKTREKTGVLILVLLGPRKIELRADSGIHKKVHPETWKDIVSGMEQHFRNRRFVDGICHGVSQVGERLATHFPRKPGDVDELPDDVIIGR